MILGNLAKMCSLGSSFGSREKEGPSCRITLLEIMTDILLKKLNLKWTGYLQQ